MSQGECDIIMRKVCWGHEQQRSVKQGQMRLEKMLVEFCSAATFLATFDNVECVNLPARFGPSVDDGCGPPAMSSSKRTDSTNHVLNLVSKGEEPDFSR